MRLFVFFYLSHGLVRVCEIEWVKQRNSRSSAREKLPLAHDLFFKHPYQHTHRMFRKCARSTVMCSRGPYIFHLNEKNNKVLDIISNFLVSITK